jgi:hypothetical protein
MSNTQTARRRRVLGLFTRSGLAGLAVGAATVIGCAQAWSKDAPAVGGQYVSLAPVAAPIVLDGQLINYIFITVQLNAAPGVDVTKLRAREPYFRDALVRAAHRTPFVKPGDYTHIDEAALKRRLMAECVRIAGPGQIIDLKILSAQAQKLTGLPKGPQQRPPARDPVP